MQASRGTFDGLDGELKAELEEGAGEVYRRLNYTRPSSSEKEAPLLELHNLLLEQLVLRMILLERPELHILQQGEQQEHHSLQQERQQGLHSLQQEQQQGLHNLQQEPPGLHKKYQGVQLG